MGPLFQMFPSDFCEEEGMVSCKMWVATIVEGLIKKKK